MKLFVLLLKVSCILLYQFSRVCRRVRMLMLRPLFKSFGENFIFDPNGTYSFTTIEVGHDVYIGPCAVFLASLSSIRIGNKVMFGPNVTIIGGNHNTAEIGKFMFDVKTKLPADDQPVVIEDDIWVGAGVIILKGVRLGRGCIVAAGAIVTKDVLPYTIVGGIPAKVIRLRYSLDTIIEHEKKLYEPNERLSINYLTETLKEHIV